MRPTTEAGKKQGNLVHIYLLLFSATAFGWSHQCEREEPEIDGPEVWSVQTMPVFY